MAKRRNLRRRPQTNAKKRGRLLSRSLNHETLEKRELLAAEFGADQGPRLISVAANSGEQFDLDGANVLSIAPQELTFRFDGARPLAADTLSASSLSSQAASTLSAAASFSSPSATRALCCSLTLPLAKVASSLPVAPAGLTLAANRVAALRMAVSLAVLP